MAPLVLILWPLCHWYCARGAHVDIVGPCNGHNINGPWGHNINSHILAMFQFGPQGRNINMLILWALCNGHNINGPCLHNINGQILFKFQIEPRGHNINMLILWPPWTCLLLWPHGHVWYCGLLVKIDIMASWLLILWCPPLSRSKGHSIVIWLFEKQGRSGN